MASVRAVMKEVLRKAPGSIRSLANEAGLSRTALRLAASGKINLTPESVRKIVRALRRWGDRCNRLADKLERAATEEAMERTHTISEILNLIKENNRARDAARDAGDHDQLAELHREADRLLGWLREMEPKNRREKSLKASALTQAMLGRTGKELQGIQREAERLRREAGEEATK